MKRLLERFITVHEAKVIKHSIKEYQLYGRIADDHEKVLTGITEDVEKRIRQRYEGNLSEDLDMKIKATVSASKKVITKMTTGVLKPKNEEALCEAVKEMEKEMEAKF